MFTLTNIPSEYNDNYIYAAIDERSNSDFLCVGGNYNKSAKDFIPALIENRRVSIPVWIRTEDGYGNEELHHFKNYFKRYSGNHNIHVIIQLQEADSYFERIFTVKFNNGSTVKSWNDGVPYDYHNP
ncbi:MAG: hypothetical protein FWC19_05465 [Treponema sp.]|nr:hypothetical protein [Treponema sp.]MCL2272235.1 hypothetical protein [Treponema sp.]